MENYKFVIDEDEQEQRIDIFIAENIEELSRSYIQNITEEAIKVNGNKTKSNYRLKIGDQIEANIPDPEPIIMQRKTYRWKCI